MATISLICNLFLAYYAYRRWNKKDRCTFLVILQFLIFQDYKLGFLALSPLRSDDVALALVLLTTGINIYRAKLPKPVLGKQVKVFIIFVLIGMIVSLFVKNIPLQQVIKGGRAYFYILVLYDVWKMGIVEIKNTIYKIFLVNMAISVIFIVQTFVPINILLDTWEGGSTDHGFLGLRRYYSFPPLISFCCMYSVFLFPKDKKHKNIYTVLSFITLLMIQSRGMLLYTVLLVIIAFITLKTSQTKKIVYILCSIILIGIVNVTVLSGDTGKKTNNDIELIFSGQLSNYERPEGEATMAFRIWMMMVRNERIMQGDIFDKIFGLGYFAQLPASSISRLRLEKITTQYYHDDAYFMTTPDISYANILVYLGYVGTFLYMYLFVKMLVYFYKNNKNSVYAEMAELYILYLFATGLNGSAISTPTCLIIPFLFLRLVTLEKDEFKNVVIAKYHKQRI